MASRAAARRATMVVAILLGCSAFALVRTGGITGGGRLDWHWRWTPDSRGTAPGPGCRPARSARAHCGGAGPGALPQKPTTAPAGKASAAPTPAPAPATMAEPAAAVGSDESARGVARISRARARQRDPRHADRDGLVQVAAGPVVAAQDRTGLVVLRGPRRSHLHPGAAGRRRDRVLLPAPHGRAGVETPATASGSGSRRAAPAREGRRPSATVASSPWARPES